MLISKQAKDLTSANKQSLQTLFGDNVILHTVHQ
jgi:hypothetical protein